MTDNKKTIAVFTPFLGGFYLGEVAAEIRKQAALRGYNLTVIMTGSFGSYDLEIGFDKIDVAIVILNAISAKAAQKLIARGIPVISTVEEYFPLEVETVVSDQRVGICKAVEHLQALGHSKIGFAGDLSIVDMRLRFEALVQCYRDQGMQFNTDYLFAVDEFTIPGGRAAGQMYLDRQSDCTAIICACDLTAMGLLEHIKKAGIRVPEDLAVVGVDNTSMGLHRTPSLTSVDQNLGELIDYIFGRVEARLSGEPFLNDTIRVEQTLYVRRSSDKAATVSIPETSRPGKTRDELINENESVMALAKSGFDSILNMSCLWGPFLRWVCLALWEPDTQNLKLRQVLSDDILDSDIKKYQDYYVEPEAFPPSEIKDLPIPAQAMTTMIPISVEGRDWAVVAVVEAISKDSADKAYALFNNFLDVVYFFMQRDALVISVREREKNAKELAERLEAVANTSNDGIWTWDLNSNTVEWNNRLLEMLGFSEEKDREIYRHMSFFERIHSEDQAYIRKLLKSHIEESEPFKAKFRIQAQTGQYIWVLASGEAIREPDGYVGRFVGSMTDITEQRISERKIKRLAYNDSLTGLPNRVSVTDSLERHILEHANQAIAVMLIDLNRFKLVNDNFGHQVGDDLLVYVAKKMKNSLRSTDIVGRFGGDEFLLLSQVNGATEALDLSERILKKVNSVYRHNNNTELAIKGSLGIAMYPDHATSSEELIKKADIAMYKAKNLMLEHAVVYSPGMDVDLKDFMAMESHLRRAIDANEISFLMQPQVDTVSEQVVGAELLCRWHSKEYGFVSPGTFIPLAEQTGIINQIGDWVLDRALEILQKWQKNGHSGIKLSINVSANQLYDPDFADKICEKVEKSQIKPDMLTLEITESAAIHDIDESRKQLEKITQKGLLVSLDDFGTGYSSLSLLNSLPLHWVKIDKSFIFHLGQVEEKDKRGMVKSITEMCHSLGYRVVAEGVETDAQLCQVRNFGCDQVQGFIYAKPISLDEFEKSYLNLDS